jgi:hypothetical protein
MARNIIPSLHLQNRRQCMDPAALYRAVFRIGRKRGGSVRREKMEISPAILGTMRQTT